MMRHLITLILLSHAFLLNACSAEEYANDPPKSDRVVTGKSTKPADLINPYPDITPPNWTVELITPGTVSYEIDLSPIELQRPNYFGGSITSDGRWERQLSRFDWSEKVLAKARSQHDFNVEDYPTAAGFDVYLTSPSLGYDSKAKRKIRQIKYLNRDKEIYCRGLFPGLIRCFGGDSQTRFKVSFHSDDTEVVLEYVASIARHNDE